MKDSKRPLDVHETSMLLRQRIDVKGDAALPKYTDEQLQEVLANTPMGQNPEDYADFYFLMQQRVG